MQTGERETIVFLIITTTVILLLISLITTLLFLYRKKQVDYFNSIKTLEYTHEKDLLKSQIEIQENTFQHISREIHDNINLSLTLAKLHLNTLDFNNITNAKNLANNSVDLITKSIEDLQNLSRTLNSDIIKTQGLINALEMELKKIQASGQFDVSTEVTGEPVFMDAEKELIIFRIVQEALNNIIKHSEASYVFLHMHYSERQFELIIKDDGIGFEYPPPKSTLSSGLSNIMARVKVLNGKSEINSQPGNGTSLKISIPYII